MALKWYEWIGLLVMILGFYIYGNAKAGDNSLLYFLIIDIGSIMLLSGWYNNRKSKKKISLGKNILYVIGAIFFALTTLIIIMRAILLLLGR